MAYDIPIEPAIEELKLLAAVSFDLPDGNLILETGGDPQQLNQADLPVVLIELDGEPEVGFGVGEMGGSAKSLTIQMSYYCWIIQPTVSAEDDIALVRNKLTELLKAFCNDRHLNDTVTNLSPLAINWTGVGRDWPIDMAGGTGAVAGYVGVRLVIDDV